MSRTEDISPEDPVLKKVMLLGARCARLSASFIGGVMAAQAVPANNASQLVDQYYITNRADQFGEPVKADGSIDEDKLMPKSIQFKESVKKNVLEILDSNAKGSMGARKSVPNNSGNFNSGSYNSNNKRPFVNQGGQFSGGNKQGFSGTYNQQGGQQGSFPGPPTHKGFYNSKG